MPRIDFVISNHRHHVEMFLPLIRRLGEVPGYHCHVMSLCELRGLPSPGERFAEVGVALTRIPNRSYRASPASGSRTGRSSAARAVARALAWHQLIRPGLKAWKRRPPDLVVLPNDGAYPYDRIVRLLKGLAVPCCLVQEGIKFWRTRYGTGQADAVAAWGENSAEFFRRQGVPAERIHLTGNPRYETVTRNDRRDEAAEIAGRLNLAQNLLLLASNPIDDLGMCTNREKLDLGRHFVAAMEPLFDDPEFHLAFKLHPRESVRQFSAIARESPDPARTSVLYDEPLYALLAASRAAVILASTVGIDALLCRVPLGVLEIPPHGFAFDYVQSGAALGLGWDGSMADQVRRLQRPGAWESLAGDRYLERNLKGRPGATELIVQLILRLAAN